MVDRTRVDDNVDWVQDENNNVVGYLKPGARRDDVTPFVSGSSGPLVDSSNRPFAYAYNTPAGAARNLYPSTLNLSRFQLKKWRLALGKVQVGQARAKIAVLGDSTSGGALANAGASIQAFSVASLLAAALSARGYKTNRGSIFGDNEFGVDAGTTLAYDTRLSMGAGWTTAATRAGAGGRYFINNSNANPLALTPVAAHDSMRITYWQNPTTNAVVTLQAGGVAQGADVDTKGTISIQSVTRTGYALAVQSAGLIKSAVDSTAARVLSIETWDSTTPAIDIFNWGNSGWATSDWTNSSSVVNSFPAIAFYAPDLTIIDLTINDSSQSIPVATYKTRLQSIITQCQLSGDVILVTGNPGNTANVLANQAAICQANYEIALANNVPHIDIQTLWESWAAANAAGFITDTLHPLKVGLQDKVNTMMQFIAP